MTSDRGRRAACIATLGCPRNEVDSESFAAVMRRAGYRIVRDPEEAVLLLLNTCAFIAPAVEESVEAVSEALAWRARGEGRRFVLAGCLPGRFGDDGSGGLEGVDAIVGPADTAALAAFLGVERDARGRSRISRRYDRYLKIADGCLNRCSFCVLPAIRGPFRPERAADITAWAGELAASGAREIGVVAQDLLAWRDGSTGPADLVSELAARHPDTWFRLYYLNPGRFDESILGAMARFRNIAPYLDIPVQHASDRILGRMNRGYGRADLERICSLVSRAGFDIACRFTVIAGYPGETPGDFEDLCSFLRGASGLRSLVVFPYWHEEGSVEYGRGDGDLVDPALVDERLGILDSIGEEAAQAWGGRLEGRRIVVLAESTRRGRTAFDAPTVDGSVLFTSPVRAGAFLEAVVESCEGLSTTVTAVGGIDSGIDLSDAFPVHANSRLSAKRWEGAVVLTTAVVLTSALFALPLTNLELAEQAVGEACSSISDSVLASGIDSVRLEMAGEHPGNWLVEQCIKAEMDGSGLVVISTSAASMREPLPAAPPGRTVTLRVRPMELSVILGSTSRSWLVGPQKVERTVTCELYAELSDSSGMVVGSVRSSAARSDRVPVSDLPELRGSSDQVWLTGGEPQASAGGLLEPLVVTGVVASLIYLFYSSRAE